MRTEQPKPPVDRLSALLAGLAPRVTASTGHAELGLHILKPQGTGPVAGHVQLPGLRLIVSPRGQPLDEQWLRDRSLESWMGFEVAFNGPVGPAFQEEFRQALEISLDSADPTLCQIVHLIALEMATRRCGQPMLMSRAGDILLIGLLRHLVSSPDGTMRLFNGLADPRIARSIVAMHTHPQAPWTLTSLALEAGMSRTSFSQHFKVVMGVPAGKYLERLRLAIAERLAGTGMGLKQVARETGYAGPSTLSRAMTRGRLACAGGLSSTSA